MVIDNSALSNIVQPKPVYIEIYKDPEHIIEESQGYSNVFPSSAGFVGKASIKAEGATFSITDEWSIINNTLSLSRKLKISGSVKGAGFLSAIKFMGQRIKDRDEIEIFAPGMIYGGYNHITATGIGGNKAGNATWIREDRLPAPIFGLYYKDGSSATVLHVASSGGTTKEDSHDITIETLINERLKYGSVGQEKKNGELSFGFVWPGSEGSSTYTGNTYPGGQLNKWRRRYHPLSNDFEQNYQVLFRFENDLGFPAYYTKAWRWAWEALGPKINHQDIELARISLVEMLGERIKTTSGLTGITNFMMAVPMKQAVEDRKTTMGFTGKALETANLLLQDSDKKQNKNDAIHRSKALNIISSFIKRVKLSPPNGEGFIMATGAPALAIDGNKIYLRSFGDDLKSLLKAYIREKAHGQHHDDWLKWAKSFADWLLPQQAENGGFPRAWEPVTGKIADPSPQSSYTIIPYLVLLSEITNDPIYKTAAIKAGGFCLENQNGGVFVGGTIDNPDVIDKEAGTLSLEAYLALYSATKDNKWIEGAKLAANFAETWMYIWDVPMPEDENLKELQWKKGVPTTGLQLISSGHSLTDAYMAFDVDEYAKLFDLTHDQHYLEVAGILLHNTKAMLALPGRLYDLNGPGWQQEHWSLAPIRGFGLHRGWLPWVSTSHLNGILGLEEYSPALYKLLKEKK